MTTEQKIGFMNFLDLDSKLQKELIEAFSKRFSNPIARGRLLDTARIPWPKQTENSWENIFFCLANNPILLKKLLYTAIDIYPEDQNLRDIVSLLAPNPKFHRSLGQSIAILAGAVCGLFVYGQLDQNVGKLLTLQPEENTPKYTQMLEETPLKQFSIPVQEEDLPAEIEIADQLNQPMLTAQAQLPASPVMPEKQALIEPEIEETLPSAIKLDSKSNSRKKCRIEGNGELIGYWYAGSTPPTANDGWITMKHGINVRLDYPDEHNGYNARAPITCVLFRNSKVPMNKPAIHVPGNKYWVPLYSNPQG